jgi:hypothetical protein
MLIVHDGQLVGRSFGDGLAARAAFRSEIRSKNHLPGLVCPGNDRTFRISLQNVFTETGVSEQRPRCWPRRRWYFPNWRLHSPTAWPAAMSLRIDLALARD